jgi:RHS repeat-associated protein
MDPRTAGRAIVRTTTSIFVLAALVAWLLPIGGYAQTENPPGDATQKEEVIKERTATSRTYKNADGSLTTELFDTPIHYKAADGDWETIESELVPANNADYAYRNKANAFKTLFKHELGDEFLRFEVGGEVFTLTLEGAAKAQSHLGEPGEAQAPNEPTPEPEPTPTNPPSSPSADPSPSSTPSENGSPSPSAESTPTPAQPTDAPSESSTPSAGSSKSPEPPSPTPEEKAPPPEKPDKGKPKSKLSYADAYPGADVTYELLPDGVKETIVLNDDEAPAHYRFVLSTPGGDKLMADEQPNGSWGFWTPSAPAPLFTLAAPFVTEATEPNVAPEPLNKASMKVKEIGKGFVVDVRLDEKWLHDPKRQFPVMLDPTITIQPGVEDTWWRLHCTFPYPSCYGAEGHDTLWIGTQDAGETFRSGLLFDLSAVPAGATVLDAQMEIYWPWACMSVANVGCWNTTHVLDAHRMTAPWTVRTDFRDLKFDPVPASSLTLDGTKGAQWMRWDVTTMAEGWVLGEQPNHGLILKRADESPGLSGPVAYGRRYTGDPTLRPKLVVTYTSDAPRLFQPDTLHFNGAELDWEPPTAGAPGGYQVHRGTTAGFAPTPSTVIATLNDEAMTSYRDTTAAPNTTFTYKIVGNGNTSKGVTVTLPPEGRAIKILQPGPAQGKATYMYNVSNCRNYGAADDIQLHGGRGSGDPILMRGLLGFDVRDIPQDATITDARLSLWGYWSSSDPSTIGVHRVTAAWDEGTAFQDCAGTGASWDEARGGVRWTSPGGDFDPAPAATIAKAAGQTGWDTWNVTSLVGQWAAGDVPNHGILVKIADDVSGPFRAYTYYSDDHGITPSLRPKLEISYTDSGKTQAPTVDILSPANGSQVNGIVPVSANATDDGRVDVVEFFVGNVSIGADASAPYEVNWDSKTLPNGSYALTARAKDDAGNTTTSRAVSVIVDNTAPPTTAITSPANGATVKGTVTISASATDDRGVSKVEFYVDDILLAEDKTASYSAAWNTLTFPSYDGPHTLTTRAYDSSGQVTTSTPRTVTVANTAGTIYRAEFTSTPIPQSMTFDPKKSVQDKYGVEVTVTNNSTSTFKKSSIFLRYRWISPDPVPVITDSSNISLGTTDMLKGTSRPITVLVDPPVLPDGVDKALYKLRFDLYNAGTKAFFAAKGNPPLEAGVIINKSQPMALGIERYYHYDGESVGAGMAHLVNVAHGNSLLSWTPFFSPGRGLATVVDITYNSFEKKTESFIGNNFSIGVSGLTRLGLPLDIHPTKADDLAGRPAKFIEFTDADGTTHRFEGKTASDGSVFYEEPPGVHLYVRQYSATDPLRKWAITRPDRVTFFFDADGYPTFVQDRNGNTITFVLEDTPKDESPHPGHPKRRVARVVDAGGRSFTLDYYSKEEAKKHEIRGRIRTITDHNGSVLEFTYYEDGNLLKITQRGGVTPEGRFVANRSFTFTYTKPDGSGPAITDPALRVNPDPKTKSQSTRLYSVRDPNGKETTFTYLGPGTGKDHWKLASRTDRAGNVTSFAYDNANRITNVTRPLSRVTKYSYDIDGKVNAITNPKGEKTDIVWAAGHVVKVIEPTGAFTEFAYNDNGYVTDIWDQLRNRTTLGYENISVDPNDFFPKWKPNRTIPHLSQLKTMTSPKGTATPTPTDDFQWGFSYDAKGNLTRTVDPENFATQFTYNPDGTIATVTDAKVNTTRFEAYDANGLVTRLVDAKGQVTTFGYTDDGLLRFIQDAEHQSFSSGDPRTYRTFFDYDSFHRMWRQTTPKSTASEPGKLIYSSAEYDANDNLVKEIAPDYTPVGPDVTSYTYDGMDRLVSTTSPDAAFTQYQYDPAGRVARLTSPNGPAIAGDKDFATFFDYDVLDRVIRQTRYDVKGATETALTTHFCYDTAGDLRSTTAPKAAVTSVNCAAPPRFTRTYSYDLAHRILSETDPLGHRRSTTYDGNGNVKTVTNAQDDTTSYSYDERDLLTQVTQPFITGASPHDVVTTYAYDGIGNLVREISPRAYDASPDKQTFTQFVTSYAYDKINQLIKIDLPGGHFIHRGYDKNGNLTSVSLAVATGDPAAVPPSSKTTLSHYDPGWVRTVDEPGNGSQKKLLFDYEAEGWQASRRVIDKPSELITWNYFADGMLREVKDKGGQLTTYTYDANNNLKTAEDASGVTSADESAFDIEVAYDTLDRVAKVRQKKRSKPEWSFTTYAYDRNSNVVERIDDGLERTDGALVKAGRRRSFTYDDADWLLTQEDGGRGPGDEQRIENLFTPTGWEAQRIVYRKVSGAWQPKQTTNWDYFANGKLKKLTIRKGGPSATVVESHDVSFLDASNIYVNGHRTKEVFTLKGPNSACNTSSCTASYTYDQRDRLTQFKDGHGTTYDYGLDPQGNITSEKKNGVLQRTLGYTGNKLDVIKDPAGAVVARHFYDDDGNLECITTGAGNSSDCEPNTSGGFSARLVRKYDYDYLNRLERYRAFSSGTKTDDARYIHDALDRVSVEEETHGSAFKKTTFSYLGLTGLVTNEELKNSSGAVTETKTYSYDAYGTRISMVKTPSAGSEEMFTYGYDVHGSVSLLLDQSSNVRATYGYSPYGAEDGALTKRDTTKPDPGNPFTYSARRFDSGSGTVDMGARRFGPDTARFLQQDLLFGALADLNLSIDPLTQNRYALAGGNPVSFIEWDGHISIPDLGGGGAPSPNPGGGGGGTPQLFTAAREGGRRSGGTAPALFTAAREASVADYYKKGGVWYGDPRGLMGEKAIRLRVAEYLIGGLAPPPKFPYEPAVVQEDEAPFLDRPRLVDPFGNCSAPFGSDAPWTPLACGVHDYGYDLIRAGAFGRSGEQMRVAKDEIDDLFGEDVRRECTYGEGFLCPTKAALAEFAVDEFGGGVIDENLKDIDRSGPRFLEAYDPGPTPIQYEFSPMTPDNAFYCHSTNFYFALGC